MSKRPKGVRIVGTGQDQPILDFRAVESGRPLLITASSAMFYGRFSDLTVLIDALNGLTFTNSKHFNRPRPVH
jgi:hypothetical protein